MNQEHVFEWRRSWFDDFLRVQRAFCEQLVADEFEFANGKNVTLTDVGVVPGCVEDLHAGEILANRLFSGRFTREAAVVNIAGQFARQFEIVVYDVFEMDPRGASVGE